VYDEAAVYEGQRDVLTIATRTWFGQGRLQEASAFKRKSLALKVDRATPVYGRNKQLSVHCQYTIRTPIERVDISPNAGVRGFFMKFIIFGLLNLFY
jgi:hypothetical protein